MDRPKWSRPLVGHRRPESPKEVPAADSRENGRMTKTFREEMREARLRQEAARRTAEQAAKEVRKPSEAAGRGTRKPKGSKTGKKWSLNGKRFFSILFVLVLLVGTFVLIHRPWFVFGKIHLEGSQVITMEDIENLGDIPEPLNIFNVNRSHLKQALEADYRVEKVDISFGLPNVLHIRVTDRRPALYVACEDGRYAKLDSMGHVIDVSNGIKDDSAPFFSGWSTQNVDLGDVVEDEEIRGLLKFMGKLDMSLRSRISEIYIDDQLRLKLYLQDGVPVIIGTHENAEKKMDQFKSICQELEAKKIKAKYIDLTYEKPYIKL